MRLPAALSRTNRNQTGGARSPKPRWHLIYYLLAAFDLVTISISLHLNHQLMNIYTQSVEVNQEWAGRLHGYSKLGQLAAAVNAPGNDVFDSHNVAAESKQLHYALRRFNEKLNLSRQELQTNVDRQRAEPLLKDLDTLETAMAEMASEADLIFSFFSQSQPEMAGRRMATMDRKYGQVNMALVTLRQDVGEIQQQLFSQQVVAASDLRKYEFVIAGFILLMVGGVTVYGHKLAQKIASTVQEKERSIQELQQAESQLKQQAQQLEQALHQLQQTPQLIQTEKMVSLGQMVAGVAHEINNPVNFIYGNLDHTSQSVQDLLDLTVLYQKHCLNAAPELQTATAEIDLEFLAEDLPKMLSSMKLGADRIRQLVLSLRNFSRLDETTKKPVDIHEGLDSTLLLLQHRLKPRAGYPVIQVVKEYGDLPLVECYAGQLNQVFMNLLTNAIDALEEAMGNRQSPVISLATPHTPHPTPHTPHPTITIRTRVLDSKQVTVQITDTGSGIPEEVRQRLFEPFFTTKVIGKGTGLGLSISYEIIAGKHGGNLTCTSSPGNGTDFIVEIPIRQQSASGVLAVV